MEENDKNEGPDKAEFQAFWNYTFILGSVIISWNNVEEMLAELMGHLVKSRKLGYAIYYATNNWSVRKDILIASLKAVKIEEDLRDECLSIIDRAGRIAVRRNSFVHATLGATTNQLRRNAVTRETVRPGRDDMFVGTEATIKSMGDLVNDISKIKSDAASMTLKFKK